MQALLPSPVALVWGPSMGFRPHTSKGVLSQQDILPPSQLLHRGVEVSPLCISALLTSLY